LAGHGWLVYGLALIMVITAGYCATRPVAARVLRRRIEPDVDVMHMVMGPAMAAMLVGRTTENLNRGLLVAFAAGVAWFAVRTVRGGLRAGSSGVTPCHHVQHVVACAGMLYMLGGTSGTGMTAMAAGRPMVTPASSVPGLEVLAVTLGGVLLAYGIWHLELIVATSKASGAGPIRGPSEGVLAPRVAAGCQLVMCVAMGGMLMATV
jgi:Domain of unknown function (DUF5134)